MWLPNAWFLFGSVHSRSALSTDGGRLLCFSFFCSRLVEGQMGQAHEQDVGS
jgi:hypothetical protein